MDALLSGYGCVMELHGCLAHLARMRREPQADGGGGHHVRHHVRHYLRHHVRQGYRNDYRCLILFPNVHYFPPTGNHKLMGVVDITCDIGGAFEMLTTSPYYPHDAVLGPHRRGVPGDMGHVFGAILWAVSAKS